MYESRSGKLCGFCTLPEEFTYINPHLNSDSNEDYFWLKDSSIYRRSGEDSTRSSMGAWLFYVDRQDRIYLQASIDRGYISPAGGEIVMMTPGGSGFAQSPIQNYSQLRENALDILDGRQLTEEEKKDYFVE